METALPGATEVLEIAKKVQMLVDDKYSFYTPAGHEVLIRQKIPVDYKIESKPEVNNLKAYYFTQRRTEFGKKVSHKGESLDKSVGANIAHVCDAWLASETVTRCKYLWGFDVYHVHDKFFCSPKNANRMRLVIRELLVELCESNYLEEVVIDITGLEDYEYVKQSNNLAELVKTADYFVC
jgi:DNA-directed RNA polymerase